MRLIRLAMCCLFGIAPAIVLAQAAPLFAGEILPNASFEETNGKYAVAWSLPGMPAAAGPCQAFF